MTGYGNGRGRALRTTATHQVEKDRVVREFGQETADRLFSLAGPRATRLGVSWRQALGSLVVEERRVDA